MSKLKIFRNEEPSRNSLDAIQQFLNLSDSELELFLKKYEEASFEGAYQVLVKNEFKDYEKFDKQIKKSVMFFQFLISGVLSKLYSTDDIIDDFKKLDHHPDKIERITKFLEKVFSEEHRVKINKTFSTSLELGTITPLFGGLDYTLEKKIITGDDDNLIAEIPIITVKITTAYNEGLEKEGKEMIFDLPLADVSIVLNIFQNMHNTAKKVFGEK